MPTLTKRRAAGALAAAELRWNRRTYHVRGSALTARDRSVLLDIVLVQTFGNRTRAVAEIDHVPEAPVPGATLTERYRNLWAWTMDGRPKQFRTPTAHTLRSIRESIARNVAHATAELAQ